MDKYRKVKVVGKGSFGYAVLVQSIADRRQHIMKIIDVSSMDRKQKEEALNEVHVLKAMRHPYIVTYRESFMDKRCLCIVMDYADGGDMYHKIAEQKKLGRGFSERQILDWFVQICLALKHVHDRKILHRDLKTQNIFLTAKGEVKVGDFGIARVLQHTYDCAQTAIGTPYYLSPEICQEKPYNQKSDIWSLGCILYEMTTLRHAFDASDMKRLVLKILRGVYPAIPATYSDSLRDLIAEMLQRDPAKRPSAKKIMEKDFLNGRISYLLSQTVAKHELGKTAEEPQPERSHTPQLKPNLGDSDTPPEEDKSEIYPARSESRLGHHNQPARSREQERKASHEPKAESIENYRVVIESIRECLNCQDRTDQSYFEEDESQRAYEKFLTPEGIPLPGVSSEDSIYSRVEALKFYLEQRLSLACFLSAYSLLLSPGSDEDNSAELETLLGTRNLKYLPLLYQLIVCEDQIYAS
jgi:NIMA (never in mitosis gene a)-related kinase